MYLEHDFYTEEWGGKLPVPVFKRLVVQASSIIDYYTFNRIGNATLNVKYAVCELIDYLIELENTGGKEILSEKVSTHSVTYVNSSKDGQDPVKKKQKDIVAKYLGHSGLMYRGG